MGVGKLATSRAKRGANLPTPMPSLLALGARCFFNDHFGRLVTAGQFPTKALYF
jgi:hypothetical protein